MPENSDADAETTPVRFTVGNPLSVASRTVFALVDITVELTRVEFAILGVQAQRESAFLRLSDAAVAARNYCHDVPTSARTYVVTYKRST